MSRNKLIPIIVSFLCVIVLGSAFGASALNKKTDNNVAESASKADSSSQAVTAGEEETDDTTKALTNDTSSAETTAEPAKSEPSTSASSASTNSTATTKSTASTAEKSDYLYAYAGFNPVTTDMSVPVEKLLLNRKYKLPDGYVPKLTEAVKGSGVKMDYRVAPHYQEMYNAAKKDGITLTPVSGYRSYERQKNNFENQIKEYMNQGMNKVDATVKASQIRLLPGTSEHNAGLAMAIYSLSETFENTKEFKWLQAHAHEYGFIMRYPKDKVNVTKIIYEPWHYRYVGTDLAKQLKSSGQVLEEYLGKDA